jgi:hypothetical protein
MPPIHIDSGPVTGWIGPALRNPRGWRGWQWNGGFVWSPAPFYWGGSFWGPYLFGTIACDMQYGYVEGPGSNVSYASYQVGASSPGAQLLADYGLEQAQCGAPGLVTIWGPDNSVICAHPNERVPAGTYSVDPTTLTIHVLKKP